MRISKRNTFRRQIDRVKFKSEILGIIQHRIALIPFLNYSISYQPLLKSLKNEIEMYYYRKFRGY